MTAHIPEPLIVEVNESHVVAKNFANSLSTDLNFTFQVVFGVRSDSSVAYFIVSSNTITLINEFDASRDLVHEGTAPQSILKGVRWWVEGYLAAIMEIYLFMALHIHFNRVKMCPGRKRAV